MLGITFKENCPDIRNSKVPDIYQGLENFGMRVSVYDTYSNEKEVYKEFGIKLNSNLEKYELIILAVAHDEFLSMDFNSLKITKNSILFDLKAVIPKKNVDSRL